MQKNIHEKLLKLKEEGRNIKEEISRLKPELQKVVANVNVLALHLIVGIHLFIC